MNAVGHIVAGFAQYYVLLPPKSVPGRRIARHYFQVISDAPLDIGGVIAGLVYLGYRIDKAAHAEIQARLEEASCSIAIWIVRSSPYCSGRRRQLPFDPAIALAPQSLASKDRFCIKLSKNAGISRRFCWFQYVYSQCKLLPKELENELRGGISLRQHPYSGLLT